MLDIYSFVCVLVAEVLNSGSMLCFGPYYVFMS